MELNQLRTFTAIAKDGNLTRASRALCLSQPAVSAQLKALESELDVQLFHRNPKGMELTRAGELLLVEANKALDAAINVMTRARSLQDDTMGEVRLGTINEPIALKLGEFLTKMVCMYPNIMIHLKQCVSGEVVERILEKELDAGYVIGDISIPGLSVITLSPLKIHVVAPVKWKKYLQFASWSDLGFFAWIGTSPKCSFTTIARQTFAQHKISPVRIVEADQECILRNLVSEGVGLSFLREDQALAAESAGEVYIWPGDYVRSHLKFIYRESDKDNPLISALLNSIQATWHSGRGEEGDVAADHRCHIDNLQL